MRFLVLLLGCLGVMVGQGFAQTAPNYRLGPEDVINISVIRHPEFSGEFLIPPDGVINMPVVGKTMASGKTIDELTAYVLKSLNSRLRNPEVTVTLKSARMLRMYVLGAVVKPGVYDFKSGWRITEALAVAGGVLDNARADAMVIRTDGATTPVDLMSILRDGKNAANLTLSSGDVVIVQKHVTRIAVLGFVNKPGYYDIDDSRPIFLSDAISLASGADNRRGGLTSVAILRTKDGKQQRLVYDQNKFLKKGDAKQNPQVFPGDIVYVPETKKPDWSFITQLITSAGIIHAIL